MKILKVLNNPIFSTIQDAGRYGFENQGVPNSGSGDILSYRLGNHLLGNGDVPSVEIIHGNLEVEFYSGCLIAITGSDMTPKINSVPVKMWESIQIYEGDILTFSTQKNGLRAYLSIKGGFRVKEIMKSSSTHSNFDVGGKKLAIDDFLYWDPEIVNFQSKKLNIYPDYYKFSQLEVSEKKLDVVKGPEYNNLSSTSKKKLFDSEFKISNRMGRTGVVLDGIKIEFSKNFTDIISDGTCKGVMQVPKDGKLYVLMEDSQRIGGYPRILSFTSQSLNYFSQLMPGDSLMFNLITIEEAHIKVKEMEDNFFRDNLSENLNMDEFILTHDNEKFTIKSDKNNNKIIIIDGKPIKLEF